MPELKFSIVIPVYNRANQIAQGIRSVLAQNYASFEIIVVDDGSTDETAEVIKSIIDPRIICIRQENKERGAARNTGIKQSTGDFVTFLDSDDEFLAAHLQRTLEFIQSTPGYDAYCTAYEKADASKTERISIPDNIPHHLLQGNFLSCNGVFVKQEVAQQFLFNETRAMSGLEDWELWLRIAASQKMIGAQLFTTRMNHHDQRSVLQTDKTQIELRCSLFVQVIKENESVNRFYGKNIDQLYASTETYMALHLALTGKYRSAAIAHLYNGFLIKPSILFTRRFLAIVKHLI